MADVAKTVEDRITFPVDFNINHDFVVSSQSKPAQVKWRKGASSINFDSGTCQVALKSTKFLPGVGLFSEHGCGS